MQRAQVWVYRTLVEQVILGMFRAALDLVVDSCYPLARDFLAEEQIWGLFKRNETGKPAEGLFCWRCLLHLQRVKFQKAKPTLGEADRKVQVCTIGTENEMETATGKAGEMASSVAYQEETGIDKVVKVSVEGVQKGGTGTKILMLGEEDLHYHNQN